MRILLIAYEFAPSPSPQSLRWVYLAGRLAGLGHEVHVMAPDIEGSVAGLPRLPESVRVHRVFAGPVRAALAWLAARRPVPAAGADAGSGVAAAGAAPPTLNWKGRLLVRLQQVLSLVRFPDLRGEWHAPAMHALPRLLGEVRPDVVVSSHEPATTLQVGLQAARGGFRWVADLGDPVLAPYTPRRWQGRAGRLERDVLREAEHVLVTTPATRELLCDRHGADPRRVTVVPQGFDESVPAHPAGDAEAGGDTSLLYAGSFYSFRSPAALVGAVLQVPGVRLDIASGNVPDEVVALAARHPDRLRLLGHVGHRDLLQLQRTAHVLVNIANRDAWQVPGKLYEYFGACRPILHLQAEADDATGRLIARLQRGWSAPGEVASVAAMLSRIRELHCQGQLDASLDLSASAVVDWSWSCAALRVATVLEAVVASAQPVELAR